MSARQTRRQAALAAVNPNEAAGEAPSGVPAAAARVTENGAAAEPAGDADGRYTRENIFVFWPNVIGKSRRRANPLALHVRVLPAWLAADGSPLC